MPVDFETHTPGGSRIDLSEGSNAGVILKYLLEHRGVGFTPAELAEATNIPRGSVGPTLQRLEDAGLVRHKEPYWAAAEDDRLAAAAASIVGVEAVADRFSDDWYATNEGWEDDLPDLSNEA
jgi:DNA-binding transcriptional ArsR family regulator